MSEDARLGRISRELFVRALAPSAADVLEPWVIDRIVSLADEVDVHEGETLFVAGEAPQALFMFARGRVELAREGYPSWTYEGRWVIGGFEVIVDRPHKRTAIALTDLHLMKLRADGWLELLEDSFDLARGLLVNAARTVSLLDRRLGSRAEPSADPGVRRLPNEPLNLIERLGAMTEMPMFRGAGVQTLADVAALADEVVFAAGQTILERGAPRERGYLILDGEVESSRDPDDVVRSFGAGTVAGGAAAFGEHGKDWALRAKTRTRAMVLPVEAWMDLMEEHFDLLRAALVHLALQRESLLEAIGRAEGTVFLR